MSIRSLRKNLPADPDNNGWVLGWAVMRDVPGSWQFIDIYADKPTAEAQARRLGGWYVVEYGAHQPGTEKFIGGSAPPQ
ncbi:MULTISPECIES: hypothetical protein [Pseudomonas]|jgi:hypothetical protein|nr:MULTISPECIES: hypothetical protein [Pseudomonas]GED77777.1 hypothetical protein PFL02_46270 [Pseudomonas fluorescens]MBP5100188.1 hypothetical protein [Pseudomonas protegens]MBP5112569.1 hypothetical protein [Pseudomonas protegens]MBP5117007.1 hypothetical protein [Pseudomonas protegens]MCS4258380.1 hypothetical protein [Pseudomonas sp. BIGb0176]